MLKMVLQSKNISKYFSDPVRVKVLKASVEDRRIDFRLVDRDDSKDVANVKRKKKDWAA